MSASIPNKFSFPHRPNDPLSIALVSSWLGAVGLLTIAGFSVALVPNSTYKKAVAASLALLAVVPLATPDTNNPVHKLGFWYGGVVLRKAASLYGLTLIRPSKPLPPRGTGVIIALEPHDILPYSLFAFAWHLNLCPDLPEGYGLMTSTVFQLPYVRQIYNYCCGDSIDKKTFTKHLKNDKTCVIIPGGVQEVIEMQTELRKDPDTKKLFLYLNERKGFVKLALMHGSTIIPSFTFGYDGSYFTWIPDPEDKWNLNKKFGFLPMLYFGRLCGFSSNVLPLGIPNPPQPLTIVMGDPIAVPKTVSPSQGDIDKYHLDFITGMKKVFEDHKVEHGYKDRELVII